MTSAKNIHTLEILNLYFQFLKNGNNLVAKKLTLIKRQYNKSDEISYNH